MLQSVLLHTGSIESVGVTNRITSLLEARAAEDTNAPEPPSGAAFAEDEFPVLFDPAGNFLELAGF
jgi:hypothetical protein